MEITPAMRDWKLACGWNLFGLFGLFGWFIWNVESIRKAQKERPLGGRC
jgi:hypothetical protein